MEKHVFSGMNQVHLIWITLTRSGHRNNKGFLASTIWTTTSLRDNRETSRYFRLEDGFIQSDIQIELIKTAAENPGAEVANEWTMANRSDSTQQ